MADDVKQIIKKCAIKLFAKKSFEATSIREIAAAAKVSPANISYHFGSKSGLFEEIINDLRHNRLSQIASILEAPQTAEDMRVRLELFTRQFIASSTEFPDESEMVQRNLNDPICRKLFVSNFKPLIEKLQEFFQTAQSHQLTREDINPSILCQLLLAPLSEITRNRSMAKSLFQVSIDNEEFRNTYIKQSVECFLNGVGHAKN